MSGRYHGRVSEVSRRGSGRGICRFQSGFRPHPGKDSGTLPNVESDPTQDTLSVPLRRQVFEGVPQGFQEPFHGTVSEALRQRVMKANRGVGD